MESLDQNQRRTWLIAAIGAICVIAVIAILIARSNDESGVPEVRDLSKQAESPSNVATGHDAQNSSEEPADGEVDAQRQSVLPEGRPDEIVEAASVPNDRALAHLQATMELLMSSEIERNKYAETTKIDSERFQAIFNPEGKQLAPAQREYLESVIKGFDKEIRGLRIAQRLEELNAAESLVQAGDYSLADPKQEFDLTEWRKSHGNDTLMIVPGRDPSENRVLSISPERNPAVFSAMDAVKRMRSERDMAIADYYRNL